MPKEKSPNRVLLTQAEYGAQPQALLTMDGLSSDL